MKIATLTFHKAVNYGAVLQAVALQQAIKERYPDYEVGILDYSNKKIEDKFKPFYIKKNKSLKGKLKSFVHAFIAYSVRSKKKKSFEKFLNDNAKLFPFTTEQDKQYAQKTIDKYIVGSDQIWNFDLSGNDDTYLLKFIEDKKKKSAYAPSIGKTQLTTQEISELQPIKNFEHISAREETAVKIIEDITNNKPVLVPDPVFLLSKENWRDKEEKYNGISSKYVLIYKFSDNDSKMTKFSYDYAKKNNYELVIIQSSMKKYKDAKIIRDASPGQFLWLIDNAQCVVTNSFHGTAFSVMFEKEFYSEANVARGTRIKEILDLYKLNSHLMIDGIKSDKKSASWKEVNYEIEKYKETAFKYIDEIVNE